MGMGRIGLLGLVVLLLSGCASSRRAQMNLKTQRMAA